MKIQDLKRDFPKLGALAESLWDGEPNEGEVLDYHLTWGGTSQGWEFWNEVNCGIGLQEKEDYLMSIKEIAPSKESFKQITNSIASLLEYKNKKYGGSALEPLNIFAKHHGYGSRIDEKLARVKNSETLSKNDVVDIIGGLILICKDNDWNNFDEFKD